MIGKLCTGSGNEIKAILAGLQKPAAREKKKRGSARPMGGVEINGLEAHRGTIDNSGKDGLNLGRPSTQGRVASPLWPSGAWFDPRGQFNPQSTCIQRSGSICYNHTTKHT
jgi:hypothetical protein